MSLKNFIPNKERDVISTEEMEEFNKFKEKHKEKKIIGTHSGTFHSDEVLSTFLLKFYSESANSVVIRTRNNEILKKCDMVVDVGGIIDPKIFRFDHHMREFKEVFDEKDEDLNKIKLSSAGLVWKYLGKEILNNILKSMDLLEANKEHINEIFKYIYLDLIMGVDGMDNGVTQYDKDIKPKYKLSGNFVERIARLNPEWNVVNVDVNERFKKGWDMAEEEFLFQINKYANSYFIAYDIVESAVKEAIKENRLYIILDKCCPWKKCLYEIEKKLGIENKLLYCVLPESNNSWCSTAISLNDHCMELRKPFPQEWRGKRGDELKKLTGISDAEFVHVSGFISFFLFKESAIKATEISINYQI
jgi:uncharacterized UPF0160 family protein